MGHGPSVLRELKKSVFVDEELLDGSARLREDSFFRSSFTNFIKSDDWIGKLTKFEDDTQFKFSSIVGKMSQMSHSINEYSISAQISSELKLLGCNATTGREQTQRTISGTNTFSSSEKLESGLEFFAESYFDIEHFSKFSHDQLLALLCSMLLPLFMKCWSKQQCCDTRGMRHVRPVSPDDSVISDNLRGRSSRQSTGSSPQAKRAQAILIGCAAYYDEFVIDRHLLQPMWTTSMFEAIDEHPFGISVVDASSPRQLIVFANKAFVVQTGYPMCELCVADMDVLNGPDTEATQLKIYKDAVDRRQAVKVGITRYSKQHKKYVDLIAARPVGSFSVAVHFVSSRASNIDDLKVFGIL